MGAAKLLRLCTVMLVLAASDTRGQATTTIPADVEAVVTGGKWSANGQNGTYRVIVSTGGFEHIVSQVQVDWIAHSNDRDTLDKVIASKIAQTGSWRLLTPRISRTGGQWRAVLDGVETHFNPAPKGTWEILLGSPGQLKTTLRQK